MQRYRLRQIGAHNYRRKYTFSKIHIVTHTSPTHTHQTTHTYTYTRKNQTSRYNQPLLAGKGMAWYGNLNKGKLQHKAVLVQGVQGVGRWLNAGMKIRRTRFLYLP